MVAYAWFNYNYRPIRAKNMIWTTLMHISGILWFVGNLVSNGHVRINGVFAHCKFWIVWFRILFCFIYATLHIVRFFALDRVFNQGKPFRGRTSLIATVVVVIFNLGFAIASQLISDKITVQSVPMLEVCLVEPNYRISAIVIQWVLWAGVAVMIYRLRNIQSSFNEFYESLALFVVAIITLIETTVTNIAFQYYPLMIKHRLEKTIVDTLAANVMIWLILGQPVYMCLFHRRKFETNWLEKLTKDGHKKEYDVSSGQVGLTTAYAKMNDSAYQDTNLNFNTSDGVDPSYYGTNFYDANTLAGDQTLRNPVVYENQDSIPIALRTNLHIHRPILNTPSMFKPLGESGGDTRRVL
ncbi:hypothetical protein GGI07_004318 [Coemansia sp. Benny D115]|nr:hypothetical protein GGI07_004318 [Coemansia sp. Benny D115]